MKRECAALVAWCGITLSGLCVPDAAAQEPAAPPQSTVPQGYEALYEQATNELATGNYAAARDLFAQAHELHPNAHTLRGLGLSELELGNSSRAAELLERALASKVKPLSPALRTQAEQLLERARAGTAPSPASPRVVLPPPSVPPPGPPMAQPLPGEPGHAAPASEPARNDGERSDKSAIAGSFYVSAILPYEGYAGETNGVGLDAGLWVQGGHFVVEPRMGVRFDAADDSRGYFHVPLELGTYFHGKVGEHSLFLGPGVGLHAIFERVDVEHTVGNVITASSHDTIEDNAFGFGVFGRAGAVLLRTSVVSIVPCVDYAITFADFVGGTNEHALRINMGILVGGGR